MFKTQMSNSESDQRLLKVHLPEQSWKYSSKNRTNLKSADSEVQTATISTIKREFGLLIGMYNFHSCQFCLGPHFGVALVLWIEIFQVVQRFGVSIGVPFGRF